MKKFFNIRHSLLLPAALLLTGALGACNSKTDSTEQEVAVTASTVAVSKFSLKANSNVAAALDSVFFSIDLNNAVIFNADSLPKGSDVSKLVPVITFPATMSKADIAVLDQKGDTIKVVDYLKNPSDSIDFSNKVVLNVTSLDSKNSLEYLLKVNVHKENPDSIGWDSIDVASMPARLSNPAKSKTVVYNDIPTSIIEESDGSYTLAKASDIFSNDWTLSSLSLSFSPDVESLTASSEALYLLSSDGSLFSSQDGENWAQLTTGWQSIIGIYGNDSVLGIKKIDDAYIHVSFADGSETEGTEIPGDFPVSGRSSFVNISNKWSESSTGFFCGGTARNGSLSDATWAYDGKKWIVLSRSLPEIEGAAIVAYTMFRYSHTSTAIRDFDAWLLIGGRLADGSLNHEIYQSFDNGVTWHIAGNSMRLPDNFPNIAGADAFTMNRQMDADLADGWKNVISRSSRAGYEIIGTDIHWDCPYIFIMGGYLPYETLSDEIWRGKLMRLLFTPIV